MSRSSHFRFLWIAIVLFFGYFSWMAIVKHDNFHSLRLDLGNMDQTVWNVARGRGFVLTDPLGTSEISRLAVHADFLLILLAPLYVLWSSPKMLLLAQAVGLALGAVPVYFIARKVTKDSLIALLFGVGYLLYPTVQLNALHDFHATSFSTTFFLFAYWFFVTRRPVYFTLFAVLAALGKEQFWAVVALMGGMWFFTRKYKVFGISVGIVSLIMFILLFWVLIPSVTPDNRHWALKYLSDYGGNINDIVTNIVVQPVRTISLLFAPDRLYYYMQLLLPVGFLSILFPLPLIFSLPSLIINALSSGELMRMIDYQYTSGITPFVFVSAIYGAKVLARFTHPVVGRVLIILCMLASVYLWGELPVGAKTRFAYIHSQPAEAPLIREIVKLVPQGATVSVSNNLGAHFSQREVLYNFPLNAETAQYVVVLLGDQFAPEHEAAVEGLLSNPAYELIAHTGQFYTFKRIAL